MSYYQALPSASLKPFIRQYWSLEHCMHGNHPFTQRVVPSGLPELMLFIGRKPSSDQRNIEDHMMISGQHTDHYDLHITDQLSLFSITFHPQGLSQFFGLPISELRNISIPLNYLNKSLSASLQDQLSEAMDFHQRVTVAEKHLSALLTNHHQPFEYRRICHAISRIRKHRGVISLATLSETTCLSRKQLEREFVKMIGITPKQFLRIIRFQASIDLKASQPDISFAGLAMETGFYDQAHLNNEFKTLTGYTPGEFFHQGEAVSDFFQEEV